MDDLLHSIGSFQFQNLIQNRIPFLLLNLGGDLGRLFPPFHQSHLEKVTLTCDLGSLVEVVRSNAQTNPAIVLICEDGEVSKRGITDLIKAGYENSYVVLGGARRLREEMPSA